jgi:hypothetical protein
MITDLISLQDAIALAQSVPDYYNEDGAKRQAEAIEIVRIRAPIADVGETQASDSWRIQIPRTKLWSLPNGDKISQGMASHNNQLEQVYTQSVVINDVRIPVILAQAILGAYFVALEKGEIIPTAVES